MQTAPVESSAAPAPSPEAAALANATRALLAARTADGHWAGELSSSALSTATALFALALDDRGRHAARVDAGIRWLVEHQNSDGGWGDTTASFSNVSTTALCWAALTVGGEGARSAVAAAERWLARAAGSLDPDALARTIAARYGKDRTFSVPILTMCALAGRLSADRPLAPFSRDPKGSAPPDRPAWRRIPQLPFELAALPQSWFRFVRLPVVSYALPALISMGLARHRHRPSRNPITRALRALATRRVLRVLSSIQPGGGGFLEATPLTSFVAMSLIGAGRGGHPVVRAGVEFLVRSTRADGSWPIDTNLATWVTTLGVNAIAAGGPAALARALPDDDRATIRAWLLGQQYRVRHPYTGAPPGAWAWTDLPGGVPDADDTAGALLALHHLGAPDSDHRAEAERPVLARTAAPESFAHPNTSTLDAAAAGITWLLELQYADGGIPTFCRGWTNLPFDRSGADLTAHALQAWHAWRDRVPAPLVRRIGRATGRALKYLARHQRPDGAWTPLWFGNQHVRDEENPTYGTAKVVIALAQLHDDAAAPLLARGVAWLADNQDSDGGWGGAKGAPSSVEETGLALSALGLVAPTDVTRAAIARGRDWLIGRTDAGRDFNAAPIGFYFAKLWYFERLYPQIFTVEGLGRTCARGRP
jgi:squalene-hopene/tetraprenyl-beta-curcumene cyclase